MLSSYKCMVNGHDEQQIIGICENIYCTQPYRRACFDCYQTHQVNDSQFKMDDIKNEKGIQKLLDEFRQNNINKINNIYAQCYIQQYFLTLKIIEYVEQYILKYSQLTNILDDLDKFVKKEWKLISLTNYIQAENNIGIYKYLQQISDKLQIIDQSKDNYIININNRIINQNFQNSFNSKQGNVLAQSIPLLRKENYKIYQLIIKNELCKKEQVNQDPWQSIKDLVDKEGQNLKNNIMKEQYDQIEFLICKGQQINEQQQTLQQSKVIENSLNYENNRQKSFQLYEERSTINGLEKYQEAIEKYDQEIKLNPNFVDAYNNKGFALHSLQRYEEAIDMYDQAIKLDPKYVKAYNNKGNLFLEMEKYEDACKTFQECLKIYKL